ncbi:hypothetical protein ABFX02_14G321800 [Erythranthe guttata]
MPQPGKSSGRFSFFGLASAPSTSLSAGANPDPPHLKLESDRQVYRPGDLITLTIEIKNPTHLSSLLIERLCFECKGIEKLDSQWFTTPKPTPDPKQRRGEYVFMDCSTSTIVSNQIISSGATKTYVVRALLPDSIPPSYRGTTIRYLYYCRATLSGQFLILEKGHSLGESVQEFSALEARIPLQIWVTQKNNGLLGDEGRSDGIVPLTTVLLDVYWKEMDTDSEWAKVNDAFDEVEEGYESSRDDILSVSSYNPMKEDINKTFGSSLSLQSFSARSSTRGSLYAQGRPSISSSMALPQLSVTEVLNDPTGGKILF